MKDNRRYVTLTDANFQKEVLENPEPVLVDFFAEWCGPCKMVSPVVEELSGTYSGRLKVVKVDIDRAQDIAGQYGIMSVPTLMIFKNGEMADQKVGALPKDQLSSWIDANL